MRHVLPRARIFLATITVALVATTAVALPHGQAATPRLTWHPIMAQHVLTVLNAQRAAHHLPPLTMRLPLRSSAHRHDIAMSTANTMAHQVTGEAAFAARVTRTGYRWCLAGENVGWNSDMTERGARDLQRLMYEERPPFDGHRRNILNPAFRDVGISIATDPVHHKMWMTEDFGRPGC